MYLGFTFCLMLCGMSSTGGEAGYTRHRAGPRSTPTVPSRRDGGAARAHCCPSRGNGAAADGPTRSRATRASWCLPLLSFVPPVGFEPTHPEILPQSCTGSKAGRVCHSATGAKIQISPSVCELPSGQITFPTTGTPRCLNEGTIIAPGPVTSISQTTAPVISLTNCRVKGKAWAGSSW